MLVVAFNGEFIPVRKPFLIIVQRKDRLGE